MPVKSKILVRKTPVIFLAIAASLLTAWLSGWEFPEARAAELRLPSDWKGPYATQCQSCSKLVTDLNRLPGIAKNLREKLAENQRQQTGGGQQSASQSAESAASLKKEAEDLEKKLDRLDEHFSTVVTMLRNCEKKYCEGGAATNVDVKLDQANKISGTNPFDVNDVERAGVNTYGSSDSPSYPPSDSPSPSPSPPVVPATPSTPVTPTTPSASSLRVSTRGGPFSFSHIVEQSPCPTPAGSVTITSNNRHALLVSNISVSGSIASVLNVTAGSNGSQTPFLIAEFNCSSSSTGTYSGNVSATVTDSVTSESQPITISASGTVNDISSGGSGPATAR